MTVRVLQFFSTLNNGGAENRMMDIYRNIDHSKVQFDFAVVNKGEHFFDHEIIEGGSAKFILPNPRKNLIKNYFSMVDFFKSHPYQAVHSHVSWYNGLVLLAAKQAGIPVRIAHARDSAQVNRPLKTEVLCRLGQILIRVSATQKIAISTEAALNIFGQKSVRENDFLLIPNSIDQKKYKSYTTEEKRILRSKYGISNDRLNIVNVGNLRQQKNHNFLLRIVSELKKQKSDFSLYLIGDGKLRDELTKQVKKMGLENEVIFLGSRQDVPEILGLFDVMVFPSLFEGLGGVVLEAQLTGVPSIVSENIPQEADLGLNFVKYLHLSQPTSDWTKAIIDAAKNSDWSRQKAEEAFANRGYLIEETAKKYLREYGIDSATVKEAILNGRQKNRR